MKIELLLKELDKLNLPKDSYVITSSGPLAIRGLREANDLDIVVIPELWEELTKKHQVKNEGFESIEIGNIQILGNGSFYTNPQIATIQEQIESADLINGHCFVNLAILRKFKKYSGREKDFKDIELINSFLNSR